jgi:hypothetical protein
MPGSLSAVRLNLMRGGYLFTAVGLIVFKWPLLLQAASMPALESAVLCILTAMSLLCLIGLRYPVGMLPILMFEVLWKVLWLAIVGLPHLIAGTMDGANESMLFSVLFVIPILAVTPWDYVWKRFVAARGDSWVRSAS